MPILQKTVIPGGPTLVLWHKTEGLDQLFDQFPFLTQFRDHTDQMPLEKRRIEWCCTQILKQELGIADPILFYQNGKPYLQGDRYISVSHGDHVAGVIAGTIPMGLDIQLPNAKIMTIQKRFCHEAELEEAAESEDTLRYLTTLWSAKEAIFKIFGEQVHFAEDLRIHPFQFSDRYLRATAIRRGIELQPRLYQDVVNQHQVVCAWLGNG